MKPCLYLSGLLFVLLSCDSDRYLGYNFSTETLTKSMLVTGRVTDTFTGNAVAGAIITVEDQQSATNQQGFFELRYIFNADADQGRPVPISIRAENYLAYETSMEIFPGTMELNIALDYGAPIIVDQAIVVGASVCQALIKDHQGQQNLTAVTVRLHYREAQNGNIYKTVDLEMVYRGDHAPNMYRYQANIPNDYPVTQFGDLITVTAVDADGFSDQVLHNSSPRTPDILLFPVSANNE
jgi:hypothetical protein